MNDDYDELLVIAENEIKQQILLIGLEWIESKVEFEIMVEMVKK